MVGNSPCASCKLLRRRCAKDCIFAPYFPSDDPQKFAIVHKVFGASNVSKMLQELPIHQRGDAVQSIVYEANARVRDPVYGCVGAISYLQNQVSELQMQLAVAQAQAEILCIQMENHNHNHNNNDTPTPIPLTPDMLTTMPNNNNNDNIHHHHSTMDQKQSNSLHHLLLPHHQYLNFASNSSHNNNSNVIHDYSLSRDTIFGPDMVS